MITTTTPLVVCCPHCARHLVLRHANAPRWMDLAAALRGEVTDTADPTGLPVALALHARGCGRRLA